MQVKSSEKQQINEPKIQPCNYTKHFWYSYIKFQLAVNFYYIWNCKYIILYILNYLIQRVHGICCNIIYNMSDKDSVPLVDNGYKIIPEINISTHGQLTAMLGGGILFGLLKIIIKMDDNNYSFATILSRYTVISAIAIFFRVISFLSTILPSPHVHCHNEDFNPPTGWGIITALNLAKGCGDLIFSSHMMHFLCALFVVMWYVLPSYDQQRVMKLMDKIKILRRKLEDSTQSYEISKYRSKIGKIQKEMRVKYRLNMISNALNMRTFNWRWAFIIFLPFFTLVFVFFIIASRGHYTVDVIVSLYFIPFMGYFVLHHWKEDIGKSLEKKVSYYYPRLCKSYIQILNNEDLANSRNISKYSDDGDFQVPLQNGTTVQMTDPYQNGKMANGRRILSQSSQFSAASLPSKYEAINEEFRPKINGNAKD